MSGRRFATLLALIVTILLLASCAGNLNSQPRSALEVEADGIIRLAETMLTEEDTPAIAQFATAVIGDLTHTVTTRAEVVFPVYTNMRFANDTGDFTLFVEANQRVNKGDVLAHLSFENERMEIDRADARRRLEQFNRNATNDAQMLRTNLYEARYALETATEANWVEHVLNLAQMELNYERFRINTNNTRSILAQELADLETTLAGEYLIAPFDGVITDMSRNLPEVFEHRPADILTLASEDIFYFEITHRVVLDRLHAGLVSHGDIVTLYSHCVAYEDGPPTLQFDAKVVSDPWAGGERTGSFVLWLKPVDMTGLMDALYKLNPYMPMQVLHDLRFSTDIVHLLVDNGVLLPSPAIFQSDFRRLVFAYENGNMVRRFITTGISMNNYTHIISGLEPGTQVVIVR